MRGLGAEAKETSEVAVAGVVGLGLMRGGVATIPDVTGVAGFPLLLTFAEVLPAAAAEMPGGISIFPGFCARFVSFTLG